MVDAVERLVNLAFFLADAPQPVSREQIRAEVAGYPEDQDEPAFLRMFERDKEDLREFGFAIETNEEGYYWLDPAATYTTQVVLTDDEAAALSAAVSALVDDPAFPFPGDLRLALAKLNPSSDTLPVPAMAALVEERAAEQGEIARRIADAAEARKAIAFAYTNARGQSATRHVEPYGLFARDGRWYVVGNDTDRHGIRVFALERADSLEVNTKAAKTPDFERPADFDVASYIMLPFQYGSRGDAFDAVLRFDSSVGWRAPALSARRGTLEVVDGHVVWRVPARNSARLAQFVVENGPGIHIVEPAGIDGELRAGLKEVERTHA